MRIRPCLWPPHLWLTLASLITKYKEFNSKLQNDNAQCNLNHIAENASRGLGCRRLFEYQWEECCCLGLETPVLDSLPPPVHDQLCFLRMQGSSLPHRPECHQAVLNTHTKCNGQSPHVHLSGTQLSTFQSIVQLFAAYLSWVVQMLLTKYFQKCCKHNSMVNYISYYYYFTSYSVPLMCTGLLVIPASFKFPPSLI